MSGEALRERRERLLGPGNPLFYDAPVHLVRGEGAWLYDAEERRYLDCYNNVPCVGHCHPRVVKAIARQSGLLNTHTRYLHDNLLDYTERLLEKFATPLDRLALACTGSEANDLAMRIARNHTGGEGFICTDATYHGNTTAVSQFSAIYEPVGGYQPHVRRVPWPDTYRLPEAAAGDATGYYLQAVADAIDSLKAAGIRLAGMMVCPLFANEGLPTVPPGYLAGAAELVRDAGGVFIVDEVQAGFGRAGRWWGHETSGLVPDIVTLGKPMAAGYPVAGVVTRRELMDPYRQREMYFNTFAGNPVACAAALAVLDVLEEEDLVANAARMGQFVLAGLQDLQQQLECIGDVRGAGLFFGIELVADRHHKTADAGLARSVVNRMREHGVLLSRIGAEDNVLKARPPLCFSQEQAQLLLTTLAQVLSETTRRQHR